jgi:hypothetical protein
MQFKTAIILSFLATIATTTFAAPLQTEGVAMDGEAPMIPNRPSHHHHRRWVELQEIEARTPFQDEQELEARSPNKMVAGSRPNPTGHGAPSGFRSTRGKFSRVFRTHRAKNWKAVPSRFLHNRDFPDDIQELEARNPLLDEQELEARSPHKMLASSHP